MRRLNKRFIDSLKPGPRARRYGDGHGLLLVLQPSGSRSWIQRVTVRGKRRDIGLGPYPLVGLQAAREQAVHNWMLARQGGDPRPRPTAAPTFRRTAEAYMALHGEQWTPKTRESWESELYRHAYKAIGKMPVDCIAIDDCKSLIESLADKPTVAKRMNQRLAAIFDYSIARGMRESNPTATLAAILPKAKHKTNHHRSVPHGELGDVLRRVREGDHPGCVAEAIEWAALTACRSAEVLGATWAEIDLAARLWTIPAERMKAGKPHQVPLSDRCMAMLGDQGEGLLFPAEKGGIIQRRLLSAALSPLGATTHGMRTCFKNWCIESGIRREVSESALAHGTGLNPVEAAYASTSLLDERREVMQRWAVYLTYED